MANGQLQGIAQGLGVPQQPQQSRAQNIGQAIGAFGAGIQGNLPQFQQVQQQQEQMQREQQQAQQESQQERLKTVYTDAQAALNLLENDNLDGVIQLGVNRLQLLQQFPDANPGDTQRLTQLAIAARNGSEEAKDLLRKELETTVEMGRSIGVLDRPERLSGSDLVKVEENGRAVYRTADEAAGMAAPGESGFTVQTDPEGGVRVQVGGQVRDVPPGSGAASDSEMEDARQTVRSAQDAIEMASGLLEDVRGTPGAVGLRGSITEAAGILSNIPVIGRNLENTVAKTVAGADPEQVQQIRSDLIAQVGAQLSRITGEESGRFTERERQIAQQALQTLEPTSSIDQAIGAQKAAMRVQLMAMTRAMERQGSPGIFDPGDDASINQFGEDLVNLGFNEEEAVDIISDLMKREESSILRAQ